MRRPRHRTQIRARSRRARSRRLSLRDGAILPWAKTGNTSPYYTQTLEALAKHYKFSMTAPWKDLPKKARDAILFGTGDDEITFVYDDGLRTYKTKKAFEGVIGNIERRWRETDSQWMREELSRYQSDHPCEACNGYRLKPQALAVKIDRLHIGQVSEMSIRAADRLVHATCSASSSPRSSEIAARILKEIRERLQIPRRCRPRLSQSVAPSRARCRAAKASASGSPRRSARA